MGGVATGKMTTSWRNLQRKHGSGSGSGSESESGPEIDGFQKTACPPVEKHPIRQRIRLMSEMRDPPWLLLNLGIRRQSKECDRKKKKKDFPLF